MKKIVFPVILLAIISQVNAVSFTVDSSSRWTDSGSTFDDTDMSGDKLVLDQQGINKQWEEQLTTGNSVGVLGLEVKNDRAYYYSNKDVLIKLRISDGQIVDSMSFPSDEDNAMDIGPNGFLYVASGKKIRKIDPDTMSQVGGDWPITPHPRPIDDVEVSSNGYVYSVHDGGSNDKVVKTDTADFPSSQESKTVGHSASNVAVREDGTVFVGGFSQIRKYDSNLDYTGERYITTGQAGVMEVGANGFLYATSHAIYSGSDSDNYLVKLDKDFNEKWEAQEPINYTADVSVTPEGDVFTVSQYDGDAIRKFENKTGDQIFSRVEPASSTEVEWRPNGALSGRFGDGPMAGSWGERWGNDFFNNGYYNSTILDSGSTSTEWKYAEIRSGLNSGNAELVVKTSDDSSFSSIKDRQKFSLSGGSETYNFDMSGRYIRFDLLLDEGSSETPEIDSVNIGTDCHPRAVGCWKMDSGSGQQVVDSSGHGNDGTLGKNAGNNQYDPDWQPSSDCYSGQCLEFEVTGTDDGEYVDVKDDDSLDLRNFTIMAWVNVDSYTGEPNIILGKHEAYKFAIGHNSWPKWTSQMMAALYDNSGTAMGTDGGGWENGSGSVPKGDWTHVAMTWNRSTYVFYQDGKVTEKETVPVTDVNFNGKRMGIGARWRAGDPEFHFDGRMDEVQLINGTINVTEYLSSISTSIKSPSSGQWMNDDFAVVVDDSTSAVACDYRVSEDGGSSWTGWSSRSCSSDFTVTVGDDASNMCSNDGKNRCWVQTRAEDSDGNTDTATRKFSVGKCHSRAVGCWNMDSGSGQQAIDSSGEGNDAVLGTDSSVNFEDPEWLPEAKCYSGQCMSFTVNNSDEGEFLTVQDDNSLDLQNFTIMAWVYPTNYTAEPNIVLGKHGAYKMAIGHESWPSWTGKMMSAVYDSSGTSLGSDGGGWEDGVGVAPEDSWSHVAWSWNGSTFAFYLNGRMVEQDSIPPTSINENNVDLLIGAKKRAGDTEFHFEGRMDEVKLINGSINVTEYLDPKRKCIPGLRIDLNEKKEDSGRLKNDKEICLKTSGNKRWYDQDYGDIDGDGAQETCKVNSLYGAQGVRWFSDSYVKSYPNTTKGGIDDDWPDWASASSGLDSEPNKNDWNFNTETPVPTGYNGDKVYTLGFCGGDDESEYLTVQRCQTGLCETNNNVKGVAKVDGSCILEGGNYPVGHDNRKLYGPGENVTFNLPNGDRTVACFGGSWHEKWPVVMMENELEVPIGNTISTRFKIINVESEKRTYLVELENTNMKKYADIAGEGKQFNITVPARSSKTFEMDVFGAKKSIDSGTVRIQAESLDSDISGEDSIEFDVKDVTGTTEARENIPGIGSLQLIVLMLLSAGVYFATLS